jgi:type II secretory pathway pseudopilin PulG
MSTGRSARSNEGGFTLAELLVVLFLSCMIMGGVATMQMTLIRQFYQILRNIEMQIQAAYALETIRQALTNASLLLQPTAGGSSSVLSGYTNISPEDSSSPILSSLPSRYFYFCLNPGSQSLYKYSGPWPMPAISCGIPAGSWEIVAGKSNGTVQLSFSRATSSTNLVDFSFTLLRPADPTGREIRIVRSSKIKIQESLQ